MAKCDFGRFGWRVGLGTFALIGIVLAGWLTVARLRRATQDEIVRLPESNEVVEILVLSDSDGANVVQSRGFPFASGVHYARSRLP